MVCALIVMLCALLAVEEVKCASTMCSEKTCLTLSADKVQFEQASSSCFENGGYLVTIRNDKELGNVKSLLALAGELGVEEKIWIGLKLSRGTCVNREERLHGFSWLTGATDSNFSNWSRAPKSTCTEERCVSLSSSSEERQWIDGSCKERAFYMCMFHFKGMCKPLVLGGQGEITYVLPISKDTLRHDNGLTLLPHGTFAYINCTYETTSSSAVCKETGAPFVWDKPGPFCAAGRQSCEPRNGGCDHLCFETDRGVRCECKDGYDLGKDKVTCVLKDNCLDSPCEHRCVNKPTGFACACPEGFTLSENQISCTDVDECAQDVCSGHICHNKHGSYECECKKGFEDSEGNCEDVDECALSPCAQQCLNVAGSFYCSCSTGFRVHGVQCLDIDECLNQPCERFCTNTHGSYRCSCETNYRLADNATSCVPYQSPGATYEVLNQSQATTADPATTPGTHQSVRKDGSLIPSWALVYVLASVVPLLLLILLTGVIAVHRWNRSRKDAKKKSATADSYCWVSSAYTAQLQSEQTRMY